MKKIAIALIAALGLSLGVAPSTHAENWAKYNVVLDPGHGGSDPGAEGPSAPHEATLALRCGLAIRNRLVNDLGARVNMSRTTDASVSLTARREMKATYDPYIFCSIHLNAFNKVAKGTETLYTNTTGNSSLLAHKVQPRLIEYFGKVSGFTPTNRGVKIQSLAVCRSYPGVPAILTEGLFVDNSTEWSIINAESKQGFKMWVEGHLMGFYDRLKLLSGTITNPNGSAPAADTTKPSIARCTTVQIDANQFYVYAYATDNVGVSRVSFPTWVPGLGQVGNDATWHNGSSGSWTVNGKTYNWRVAINKSSHSNNNGPYATHVYAYDAAGNSTSADASGFTFDLTKPTIARATVVQADANNFKAYAYATDNVKVTRVQFPSWTDNGGQDDLVWHEGTSGSYTINGQTYNWTATIAKSSHKNENGPYFTHVYAYDAANNSTSGNAGTFTFDTTSPAIERTVAVDNDDASFYVYSYATDNVKVTRARFPTWLPNAGQVGDNAIWHEGELGNWAVEGKAYNCRCLIKKADHSNSNGPYTIHVYVYDAAGNKGHNEPTSSASYTFGQGGSSSGGSTTTTVDNIDKLEEVWNFSQISGKTANWITNGSQVTQDMAFKDGKLYVVHRNGANTDNKIYIVDAYTGAKLGELPTSTCTAGTYLISSIENFGGKIVACNLAGGGASPLIVYAWDNDTSEPSVLLSTTSHNNVRAGDAMSVSGNMTNGKIWFAGAGSNDTPNSDAYYFTVTNGVASTTPTVINLKKADGTTAYTATNSATPNVAVADDNTIWVSSKDHKAAHFGTNGVFKEELAVSAIHGTDIEFFTLGSKKYAVATDYLCKTATTISEGVFDLFNITDGISAATKVGSYPSAGLGTTRNTSFRSTVNTYVDDTYVHAWVLIPMQGAAYYRFKHTTVTEAPAPTNSPELSVNPTAAAFDAEVGKTTSATITVNGSNLTGDITLTLEGTNANMFTISSSKIAQATAHGDITITYTPTAAGNHSATLTIKSTDAKDKSVTLSGHAYVVDVPDTFDDNIKEMSEGWIYSTNKGNTADAPWLNVTLTDNYTRDIAVNGDHLYVLNMKQWGAPSINILNAYTGEKIGTMSVEGIAGGRATLAAIDMLGDKLIGVNAVNTTQSKHTLTFYKWDSEAAAPSVWATASPDVIIGDQMSVTGNMTNGAIYLVSTGVEEQEVTDANGTVTETPPTYPTIYKYTISNGSVNTTPTIITLSDMIGVQNGNASVAVAADGSYWVDGKDIVPTHFDSKGTIIETLDQELLGTGKREGATAVELIAFGEKTYLSAATYVDGTNTLANGAIAMVNLTNGNDLATNVGTYPNNGFGTTRNTQFVNALAHSTSDNGHTLNIWGVVAGQGIAYYKYEADSIVTGVDDIVVTPEEQPIEWYNLQGVRVDGENMVPGIYIRRQGNDVKKILMK